MILELKPEQQRLLERAAQSGMSPEELIEQAFAVIGDQFHGEDWFAENRETLQAHLAEGFEQAERGELLDPDEAVATLKARRAARPTT